MAQSPLMLPGTGEMLNSLPPLLAARLQEAAVRYRVELDLITLKDFQAELSHCPLAAIEYAFDQWRSHGKKFPVPADIREHVNAWTQRRAQDEYSQNRDRYKGNGYGNAEVLMGFELMVAKRAQNPNMPRMTSAEIDGFIDELDEYIRLRKEAARKPLPKAPEPKCEFTPAPVQDFEVKIESDKPRSPFR